MIIVLWLIVLGFSIWLAPKFIGETSSEFNVPDDTPSAIANEVLKEEFPDIDTETTLVVVIYNTNGTSLCNETRDFCYELKNSLLSSTYGSLVTDVNGYYFMIDIGLPDAAFGYVSDSTNTTILEINLAQRSEDEIDAFIEYLRELVISIEPEGYTVLLTGGEILFADMRKSAEEDIIMMDSIVLPIALIVLALVLKSFRLMILPIISVGFSIATSFFLMYPLALAMPVFSFVPSVIMSLVIALSIDYSLFLLSRYREELINEKSNDDSVKEMLEHAGHTISVSGITLAITFLGLVFFPVGLLASIGLGAVVCILVTLLVNLTLIPSLLILFGKFFSNFNLLERRKRKLPEKEQPRKLTELQNQMKSIWFKLGKFTTRYAIPIIIIIFAVAIPISIQTMKMGTTIGENHIMPRNADSTNAFAILKEDFQPGILGPMYLIVETDTTNGVISPEFFTFSRNIIINIAEQTEITNNSFITISWGQGFVIPFFIALNYLDPLSVSYNTTEGMMYRMMFGRYTNEDNSTVLIDIQPNFDPFGSYVEDWIKDTRVILNDFQTNSSYTIHLAGGSTEVVDAVDRVYSLLPMTCAIIVAVVYIVIAIMFRSILIPFRLILTIGLTISWIYGLSALIFDVGILDWLFPALRDIDSLYWATIPMSFSILIGLGLDYDIFLLSRVSEFRNKGYTE
ncbi:MAG: MMPL family transporter, partial [Candidatus Heimdallarchaeaceae archaeon]